MKKTNNMSTHLQLETRCIAASLVGEMEEYFVRIERLRDGYGALPAKDARALIRRVQDLILGARSCFRVIDFWYPQEQLFLPAFENMLELLPKPPDADRVQAVYPFLRELHGLLLKAITAMAGGDGGQPVSVERDAPVIVDGLHRGEEPAAELTRAELAGQAERAIHEFEASLERAPHSPRPGRREDCLGQRRLA